MADLVNVIFEVRDGLAKATLNRPKCLNAVDYQTLMDLDNVCAEVEKSESIKVLIIAAAGTSFCAGADLRHVTKVRSEPGGLENFIRTWHRVYNRIEDLPVPTIAAIQGYALAGGLELAMTCDMRVLADNALVGDQHINFGLIPGGGATQRLPRLVGTARAKEIILTGAWLKPDEAERIGLANSVVPSSELMAGAEALAAKMLDKSRSTARVTKRLINKGMQVDIYSGLEMEIVVAIHANLGSDDVTEGLKAFAEKRDPSFKSS